MPHIDIKCFPRDLNAEQKQALADDLCAVLKQHLGASDSSLSVALTEIPANEWKDKVYDPIIKPALPELLKQPGYEF